MKLNKKTKKRFFKAIMLLAGIGLLLTTMLPFLYSI